MVAAAAVDVGDDELLELEELLVEVEVEVELLEEVEDEVVAVEEDVAGAADVLTG